MPRTGRPKRVTDLDSILNSAHESAPAPVRKRAKVLSNPHLLEEKIKLYNDLKKLTETIARLQKSKKIQDQNDADRLKYSIPVLESRIAEIDSIIGSEETTLPKLPSEEVSEEVYQPDLEAEPDFSTLVPLVPDEREVDVFKVHVGPRKKQGTKILKDVYFRICSSSPIENTGKEAYLWGILRNLQGSRFAEYFKSAIIMNDDKEPYISANIPNSEFDSFKNYLSVISDGVCDIRNVIEITRRQ